MVARYHCGIGIMVAEGALVAEVTEGALVAEVTEGALVAEP